MLISAILVSTSFTVGAFVAGKLDPLVLTLIRFLLASLFLLPYIWLKHGLLVSLSLVGRCSIISGCLVTFFWCMFLSLEYTTALNTSVLFTLVPLIAGIYAFVLLRERVGKKRLIALCIGLIGAIWVIFRGDFSQLLLMEWNKGDIIFFAGCLLMGLYTILIRLLYRNEPMIVMTFWILVTGCVWLIVFGSEKMIGVEWGLVTTEVWWSLLYLAVFTTIITFFITQYAILYLGPTRVMAYSYLYPAIVLIIDVLLGHGLPEIQVLPGILVVIFAMFVILRVENHRKPSGNKECSKNICN